MMDVSLHVLMTVILIFNLWAKYTFCPIRIKGKKFKFTEPKVTYSAVIKPAHGSNVFFISVFPRMKNGNSRELTRAKMEDAV